MQIQLKCPRCEGKLYEDDIYWENSVKKVELGCYACPYRKYLVFKLYKYALENIIEKRKGTKIAYR